MHKIGIFFGTESGTTRLIAKKIARKINTLREGEPAAKPINVNRIDEDQFLLYDKIILGTPTYSDGKLPGKASGNEEESWLEFLEKIKQTDLSDKQVALYGLGDQENYPDHFADGVMRLHRFMEKGGAKMVGGCSVEGFEFNHSLSVVDGRFVGLVLDQHLQNLLTDQRIDDWLEEILPLMLD
jgi:flavodoxin I